MSVAKVRCWWCLGSDDYVHYHDQEWGVPVTDDQRLFEKLALEGFQSGLSWITILRKRERFREVFHDFTPERVAAFGTREVTGLLNDPGIIRHRGKIEAVIQNARAYAELRAREGSLAAFVWGFAREASPVRRGRAEVPSTSPESVALAKELKRRGWRFVGPTTVYAFFQAMGLVNDHVADCFRHAEVAPLREAALRRMAR